MRHCDYWLLTPDGLLIRKYSKENKQLNSFFSSATVAREEVSKYTGGFQDYLSWYQGPKVSAKSL